MNRLLETESECPEYSDDLHGDGLLDLQLKFDAADLFSAIGPMEAGEVRVLTLTGSLYDGTAITGEDVIVIRN